MSALRTSVSRFCSNDNKMLMALQTENQDSEATIEELKAWMGASYINRVRECVLGGHG